MLRDLGDLQGAASAYIAAMQAVPGKPQNFNIWNRILAAQQLLEIGQVAPVVKMMPALVAAAKSSNYRQGILRLADLYRELGDRQAAESLYVSAEQLSDAPGGTYRMARQLYETGKFEQLLAVTQAYDAGSSDTRYEVENWKIQALAELGRTSEASKAAMLFVGLGSDPNDEDYVLAYLRIAKALKATEQLKSAAERLVGIYKIEAASSKYFHVPLKSLVELMSAYEQLGMQQQATTYAQAVLAAAPDAPLAKFQWARGQAARVLGQRDSAVRNFLNAQRLDAQNFWIKKETASLSSTGAGLVAAAASM